MIKQLHILFFVLTFCFIGHLATAQKTKETTWTKKQALRWFTKKQWANGLTLNADPSTNTLVFAEQYHQHKDYWDKAFAFLKNNDLETLAAGKYPIEGEDVYATVTIGATKPLENTGWESHRKYIDLQYVIRGQEKIGVASVDSATITKPYDETKDLQNYTAEGKYYVAKPGTFFLFFPTDAHRPTVKVEGFDQVKKIVIKIRTAG